MRVPDSHAHLLPPGGPGAPPPSLAPPLPLLTAGRRPAALHPSAPSPIPVLRAAAPAAAHLCATSPADWDATIALASAPPSPAPPITASIGFHPFHAADALAAFPSPAAAIRELRARLLSAPIPLGIGEIGLDAPLDASSPADAPLRHSLFRAQLDLSYELARPVTIHGRGCWPAILRILDTLPPHPAGILLHAYGGPSAPLPSFPSRNIYASYGPILLRPSARRPRRLATLTPLPSILLESDSAFSPPSESTFTPPSGRGDVASRRQGGVPAPPPSPFTFHFSLFTAQSALLSHLRSLPPPTLASTLLSNHLRLFHSLVVG